MTDQEFSDFISEAIRFNESCIQYAEKSLELWRSIPGGEANMEKARESLDYHRTAIQSWRGKYRERFGCPALNS